MVVSVKIVGISFLFFMLATYISFQMGWSFWHSYEFFKILRFIELGMKVKMVETFGTTQAVDVPEDLNKVLEIINETNIT